MSGDQTPIESLVYCGRRLTSDNKIAHDFIRHDGQPLSFTPKKQVRLAIGVTYAIEHPSDTTWRLGTARGLASVAQHEMTAEWRVLDHQARMQLQAAQVHRKLVADNDNLGRVTLDHLAHRYTYGAAAQRAALLAVVIRYVQTGR